MHFRSTVGSSVDYEAVGLVDSKLETFSVFTRKNPETNDQVNDFTLLFTSKMDV